MSLFNKILGRKANKNGRTNALAGSITNESTAYPNDFSKKEIESIEAIKAYSMTGHERLIGLLRAVDYLETNKIQGDIVECGVWRGGSMMLVAKRLLELKNASRKIYLYDTFEGMTEPTNADVSFDNETAHEYLQKGTKGLSEQDNAIWCYSTLEEVRNNLYSTQYPKENLFFIQGKVEETLPTNEINEIALLRLDTDWYESTKQELIHLYDKLVVGGVLIIDDYGHWEGAKKAVDEFIEERGIRILLNRLDYTGRIAVKIEK